MAEQTNLFDALALEKNRFMKFLSEAAAEARIEVATLEGDLSAKGVIISGVRFSPEVKIRFEKHLGVAWRSIELRKELGRSVPDLLEEQQLAALKDKLFGHVDRAAAAVVENVLSRVPDLGGAVRQALRANVEHEASSAKVRIGSELSALRLESRLGLYRQEKPSMTFNISHSTIASLNLGTVVRDLTASFQSLVGQGQDDLAEALRGLTEAIAASKALGDPQRKELLEHLSLVCTEVALPPERRKTGLLKSSIAFLQTGLSTVAQLASLMLTAEQALKAFGVLPS